MQNFGDVQTPLTGPAYSVSTQPAHRTAGPLVPGSLRSIPWA